MTDYTKNFDIPNETRQEDEIKAHLAYLKNKILLTLYESGYKNRFENFHKYNQNTIDPNKKSSFFYEETALN